MSDFKRGSLWTLPLLALLPLYLACSEPRPANRASLPPAGMIPVPQPQLESIEPAFARHLRRLHADVEQLRAAPPADPAALAASFGRLGQHYAAFGFLDAAEAALANAEAAAPADYRWAYLRGLGAYERGDLAAAATCFERSLRLEPYDPAAALHLGTVYLELGQPQAARPWLSRALELEPDSAAAHHRLGQLASAEGDHRTAITAFESALALQPEASAVHYALGQTFRRLGNLQAAQTHLELSGEQEPRARDPLLRELGDLVHRTAFEAIVADVLGEGDFSAAATLELALRYLGDLEGNVEEIERYLVELRQRPGGLSPLAEARFHYLLAGLCVRRGEDGRAIERLLSAVELAGEQSETRLLLANALGRAGRYDEALHHFTVLLAIDPERRDARQRRAATYFRLGRFGEAVDDLVRVVELDPENPEARMQLAVARLKSGDLRGFELERQALLKLELTPDEAERAHIALGLPAAP